MVPVALAILALLHPGVALSGPNSNTTLVLHAVQTSFGVCDIPDPCADPGGPTVNIASGQPYAVYFILRNYDSVAGVQFALDWPVEWQFAYGLWDCLPGSGLCETHPWMPGPTQGTYACGFDCITGGASMVVGRMHFFDPTAGCLQVIESSYYNGTHVVACNWVTDPIILPNRGRVCVGTDGFDACDSVLAIEGSTWGRIKGTYQ